MQIIDGKATAEAIKAEISALRGTNPDSPADYVRTIKNVTMKPNTT